MTGGDFDGVPWTDELLDVYDYSYCANTFINGCGEKLKYQLGDI
jgi:hypothetical protein